LEAIIGPDVLTKPEAGTLTSELRKGAVNNPNTPNDRVPPSKVTHMDNVRILATVNIALKNAAGNKDAPPDAIIHPVLEAFQEFLDGVTGKVSPAKALERLQAQLGAQGTPSPTPQGLPAATPMQMPAQAQAPMPPPQNAGMGNSPQMPPAV
jgi:hypothetical protein